jgi:hypothetical protein
VFWGGGVDSLAMKMKTSEIMGQKNKDEGHWFHFSMAVVSTILQDPLPHSEEKIWKTSHWTTSCCSYYTMPSSLSLPAVYFNNTTHNFFFTP